MSLAPTAPAGNDFESCLQRIQGTADRPSHRSGARGTDGETPRLAEPRWNRVRLKANKTVCSLLDRKSGALCVLAE